MPQIIFLLKIPKTKKKTNISIWWLDFTKLMMLRFLSDVKLICLLNVWDFFLFVLFRFLCLGLGLYSKWKTQIIKNTNEWWVWCANEMSLCEWMKTSPLLHVKMLEQINLKMFSFRTKINLWALSTHTQHTHTDTTRVKRYLNLNAHLNLNRKRWKIS